MTQSGIFIPEETWALSFKLCVCVSQMKCRAGVRSSVRSPVRAASSSSCTHSRLGKVPNLQTEKVVVEMKGAVEQKHTICESDLIIPSYSILQTGLSLCEIKGEFRYF